MPVLQYYVPSPVSAESREPLSSARFGPVKALHECILAWPPASPELSFLHWLLRWFHRPEDSSRTELSILQPPCSVLVGPREVFLH